MVTIISTEHLIHSIKSLAYTSFRMEERLSGCFIVLSTVARTTVFQLNEPMDGKAKAKLRLSLEEFKRKMSHNTQFSR
jgi:hypothetical protein